MSSIEMKTDSQKYIQYELGYFFIRSKKHRLLFLSSLSSLVILKVAYFPTIIISFSMALTFCSSDSRLIVEVQGTTLKYDYLLII